MSKLTELCSTDGELQGVQILVKLFRGLGESWDEMLKVTRTLNYITAI